MGAMEGIINDLSIMCSFCSVTCLNTFSTEKRREEEDSHFLVLSRTPGVHASPNQQMGTTTDQAGKRRGLCLTRRSDGEWNVVKIEMTSSVIHTPTGETYQPAALRQSNNNTSGINIGVARRGTDDAPPRPMMMDAAGSSGTPLSPRGESRLLAALRAEATGGLSPPSSPLQPQSSTPTTGVKQRTTTNEASKTTEERDVLFFTMWEKERELAALKRRLEDLEIWLSDAKRGKEAEYNEWKSSIIITQ